MTYKNLNSYMKLVGNTIPVNMTSQHVKPLPFPYTYCIYRIKHHTHDVNMFRANYYLNNNRMIVTENNYFFFWDKTVFSH